MAAADSQQGNVSNGAGGHALRCPSCRSQVKPADAACPMCGYALHAEPVLEATNGQEVALTAAPPSALPPPAQPAQPKPVTATALPSASISTSTSTSTTKPEPSKTPPVKLTAVPVTAKPAQSKVASKRGERKPAARAIRRRVVPPIVGFIVVFIGTIGGVLLLTAAVRNLMPMRAGIQSTTTAPATGLGKAAIPVATAKLTPTPMTIAAATDATGPNGMYDVELVTARYEITGRPAKGCGLPNATDLVRKFTFTLAITNKTGADTDPAKWGTAAFTRNGRAFQVCYFDTEGALVPGLPKNRTQRVTLSAFVEPNESVAAIVVGDNAGNAQRICVRGTQRVKCQ